MGFKFFSIEDAAPLLAKGSGCCLKEEQITPEDQNIAIYLQIFSRQKNILFAPSILRSL
jgi:hypothetical protein